MGDSHKERHQWKKKERVRTGEADPLKIRKHRERFLARLKAKTEPVQVSNEPRERRMVFKLRLLVDPENLTSTVFCGDQEVASAEHLAFSPEDIEYVIRAEIPDLDSDAERKRLAEHVKMISERGIPCGLEVLDSPNGDEGEKIRLCESCFACPHRQWDNERNLPLCERPR